MTLLKGIKLLPVDSASPRGGAGGWTRGLRKLAGVVLLFLFRLIYARGAQFKQFSGSVAQTG